MQSTPRDELASSGDAHAGATHAPAQVPTTALVPAPADDSQSGLFAGGWLALVACIAVIAVLGGSVRWLWHNYETQTAQERSLALPQYTELPWDDLVPKDWDPMRQFRAAGIDRLDDADPAAITLARRMRETWDNAPTNRALDGSMVRLSGYVVPLDMSRTGMREFLLVPYFGACIHVPAPAANQLVHVRLGSEQVELRSMDTVWVSGRLHTARSDSAMGVSGYALEAHHVERRAVPGR